MCGRATVDIILGEKFNILAESTPADPVRRMQPLRLGRCPTTLNNTTSAKRDADFLQVFFGNVRQGDQVDIILGEKFNILAESELFQPLTNIVRHLR